jgi:hypothetical protein
MDWDQRAFAWLYRSFRRVSGRGGKVDEAESPVESLTPRFETLSNLITGDKWEVVAGAGMGGVAPGRLVLPQALAWLADPDDQASFYLYRVVIGVTAAELGFVADGKWSGHRRALAMLIGMPSIQEAIAERYPGAESLVTRCGSIVTDRFPFDTGTADARCFSMACKALLGSDAGDPSNDSAASIVARELVDAATPGHTPQSLVEASSGFESVLAKLSKRRASGEYKSPWGLLMPPPTPWNAALDPPDDPQSMLPSGTERKMRRRPTDVEYVDLESQKDRDNPLVHSFEKVHTATEYQSGRKQLDGSDQLAEQEEALDELELTKLTRTTETAQSIYRADLQAGLHTADLAEGPESTRAHRYPEWNFKRREYRADWCTVNEHLCPPSSPASTVTSASRRLHGEVLRLQAELKRLELERRWRNRQLDGAEIDIDALVDRQATLMARSGESFTIPSSRCSSWSMQACRAIPGSRASGSSTSCVIRPKCWSSLSSPPPRSFASESSTATPGATAGSYLRRGLTILRVSACSAFTRFPRPVTRASVQPSGMLSRCWKAAVRAGA